MCERPLTTQMQKLDGKPWDLIESLLPALFEAESFVSGAI